MEGVGGVVTVSHNLVMQNLRVDGTDLKKLQDIQVFKISRVNYLK